MFSDFLTIGPCLLVVAPCGLTIYEHYRASLPSIPNTSSQILPHIPGNGARHVIVWLSGTCAVVGSGLKTCNFGHLLQDHLKGLRSFVLRSEWKLTFG